MVQLKIYSLDGVSALRSCPPSDARCSVSWLYTVIWIKIGNRKVPQNMRCIMVLRQNSVLAISLLCLPTLEQKLVGKGVLIIFRQNHNVQTELMFLGRATCLSYSPSRRCRICELHLSWIQEEPRLHVQLLA